MLKIKQVIGREILDSRGNPTVEADLVLEDGQMSRASVPSGASTGKREALELRDNDPKRFHGLGVLRAVDSINEEIQKNLIGVEVDKQEKIDQTLIKLDNTINKSRLGANAILAVSIAATKAAALANNLPVYRYLKEKYNSERPYFLPVPLFNVLNGGMHAFQSADLQEFKIVPFGAPSFREALRWSAEVFQTLKKVLKNKNISTAVGDEGGFAPSLSSNQDYFDLIIEAIGQSGYKLEKDFYLAIDAASSSFYHGGTYNLKLDGQILTSQEMINYWDQLSQKYPIISLEDGLAEDDWNNWANLNKKLGAKMQILGDDIFVTNSKIIEKGITDKIANAVLIKMNQIGTITETIDAIKMAQQAGWAIVISHRSGETEDSFIADLAVGLGANQIKSGSLSRSERMAKYNQLARIEEQLGDKVTYDGKKAFSFLN